MVGIQRRSTSSQVKTSSRQSTRRKLEQQLSLLLALTPEQLLIKKNGIQLVGQEGAMLVPSTTFVQNICSGVFGKHTQAGICIAGSGVKMAKFVIEHRKVPSVKRPVEGVLVSGFHIRGFVGANILALGAKNTHITKNKLVDGPVYGFLTSGSRDTHMAGNIVTSSDITNPGFIAMCMDNFDGVLVTGNTISAYANGFCVQTDKAVIHGNSVKYTCNAALVDPYTNGIKFTSNHISAAYNQCGNFGSYGIALSGATNALVQGNTFKGIHNAGPAAGVKVVDDPCTEPSLSCLVNPGVEVVAMGNKIVGNTFSKNDLDLENDSTGSGTAFSNIQCSTSTPAGLCG